MISSYESVKISSMTSYIEVNIDRDITAPEDFREEIAAIRGSKEGDVIHMTINTGGGRLDTTSAILSAMRSTKAHIITEAVGTVASAGTLLFLAGDEFKINQDLDFMAHTASGGMGGKSNNVVEQALHQQKSIQNMFTSAYQHFLTDSEIESMLNGADYWMEAEEVADRLKSRAVIREQIEAEAAGIDLNLSREDFEKWTKARLVSFICDEDYQDSDWDKSKKGVTEEELSITVPDELLEEALANPSSETGNNVKEVLKEVAVVANIRVAHNIGLIKLYDKVKHLLE
jgi:ATP-dependent protease ClpP protease subunit